MYDFNDPLFQVLIIGAILTIPLKMYAVWKAAQAKQKGWFVVLLLLNSIGLLEVTYLFYFQKKPRHSDTPEGK